MARKPMNHWAGKAEDLAKCYPESDANGSDGYIRISRNNVVHQMHRWIWKQLKGPIPVGYEIDHINRIRTDNRITNLRCIPKKEQLRNQSKRVDNTSGRVGVSLWEPKNGKGPFWRGSIRNKSGKTKNKVFSIPKYGFDTAYELACQWRTEKEKEFDYHPNHGKVI